MAFLVHIALVGTPKKDQNRVMIGSNSSLFVCWGGSNVDIKSKHSISVRNFGGYKNTFSLSCRSKTEGWSVAIIQKCPNLLVTECHVILDWNRGEGDWVCFEFYTSLIFCLLELMNIKKIKIYTMYKEFKRINWRTMNSSLTLINGRYYWNSHCDTPWSHLSLILSHGRRDKELFWIFFSSFLCFYL